MKFSILFLVINIFSLYSLIAQKENLILNNLNWNSTTKDIKRLFGNDLNLDKKDENSNGNLKYYLTDYNYLGSNFTVYLKINDKTNKLNGISLQSQDKNSGKWETGLTKQYDNTLKLILLKLDTPTFYTPSTLRDSYYWYNDTTIISISKSHSDDWRNGLFIGIIPYFSLGIQQRKPDFTFRHTKWAYSKEEVIKNENLIPITNTSDTLKYKSTILDMKCLVEYFFNNDYLFKGKYSIKDLKTKNEYVENYNKLKDWIVNKYGNASFDFDNYQYKREMLTDDESISLKCKMYYSYWIIDETIIEIMLTIENNKSELVVQFSCLDFTGISPYYKSKHIID